MTELQDDVSGWIFIPPALDDAGLSAEAFRVYCHLARSQELQKYAYQFRALPIGNEMPIIPPELDDAGLSAGAFRVYCHLVRRSSQSGDDESPSAASIAPVCRLDRNAVWRALDELTERGMVAREKSEGLPSRYILTGRSSWRDES